MKFGKQLESEAEDIPSDWRPYLIHYKALKKLIAKVTEEIEDRGLSAPQLHDWLDTSSSGPCDIKYYFTGDPPNIRPCIAIAYDPQRPEIAEILHRLTATAEEDRPALEYRHSLNDTDFFTLTSSTIQLEETSLDGIPNTEKRRSSLTTRLIQELVNIQKQGAQAPSTEATKEDTSVATATTPKRTLVIELEQDDEFFHALVTELERGSNLQDQASQRFKKDIGDLESALVKTASPQSTSDMYTWRHILSLYLDAHIFQSNMEQNRTTQAVQKSKDQLAWFIHRLQNSNQTIKLKDRASKSVLEHFITLNRELVNLMHYQLLNQTAVRKILKKHDKRSGLTASTSFPLIMRSERFYDPKMANMLCATIIERLTSVIPQPDDYACPVCMNVAWRPIRLVCGHVFCVRCLIKAQKKRMDKCPLCREQGAVLSANATNLDMSMQDFMKLYFPREIKQKKKDNMREQEIEDIQRLTGRVYSPEQLQRMQNNQKKCVIM